MTINEDVKKVKDIVQSFVKSKKIVRMYPNNNPIYLNTLEDDYSKLKDFFYYKDDLVLHIRQNEILYDAEQVYFNPDKDDNLALFFFKDGLREITFKKGLSHDELEDFLKIISLDFSWEALDDDVVTLFWEKDFQNIHYVVDESVLADEEDYETKAVSQAKEKEGEDQDLLKAYEDALRTEEGVEDVTIVPLTDKDLQLLVTELDRNSLDKIDKVVEILFEMFYMSENRQDFDDLVNFFLNAVEYSIRQGNILLVTSSLSRLHKMTQDKGVPEELKRCAKRALMLVSGDAVISLLGEVLDSGQEVEDSVMEDFVRYLDRTAIAPFMKILGELQSIHARKIVIDALIHLGTKDITALSKGLSDSRWYVVRNIIYILRKIGDKRAVDYLLKTIKHGDIRVKKEVIRALGELGGGGVLQALRECLDDPDIQVRIASLKAFGTMGSEAAKRILMNRISDKNFKDKEFDEKKEFFEVLARWKDNEVVNFLTAILKNKTFFGRTKNYENRACAAYSLGLVGSASALPLLNKTKNDGNKLLREFTHIAIKRIGNGQ
jgi:HEAT repeat protein